MVETSKPRPDREDLELRAFKAQQIAEKLRELESTDGWATLREIFEAAEKNYYTRIAHQLMRGAEIDQRKLDYNRGIFDGVKQLLEQPARAQSAFAKALERIELFDDTDDQKE